MVAMSDARARRVEDKIDRLIDELQATTTRSPFEVYSWRLLSAVLGAAVLALGGWLWNTNAQLEVARTRLGALEETVIYHTRSSHPPSVVLSRIDRIETRLEGLERGR